MNDTEWKRVEDRYHAALNILPNSVTSFWHPSAVTICGAKHSSFGEMKAGWLPAELGQLIGLCS